MASRDDDKVFDEADVQIMFGLCLGMSQEAVGNWVATPVFPAGFSERTVRNRMAANREAYDRVMARLSPALKRKEEALVELSKSEFREKLEKLRSLSYQVKEAALRQALTNEADSNFLALGVKVAESVEDRDFGKAKQVVDYSGEVNHNHFVWTAETPKQLMAQERDMLDSGDLLKQLPGDVLEAELVTDA